jgi:hypothetical protein
VSTEARGTSGDSGEGRQKIAKKSLTIVSMSLHLHLHCGFEKTMPVFYFQNISLVYEELCN